MAGEDGNFLYALAQRRHFQGKAIQAVVEVFSENLLRDGRLDVDVGCGDHPHIHFDAGAAAQAGKTSILKNLQQLGLQNGGHFANLIQKNCAVIANLELARFGLDRAGKRALLVAEQFALQQIGGHCRAIHLHEARLAARRHLVNEKGCDFLAGAALSQDQDRNVSLRYQPALRFDLPHPLAAADKGGVLIQGNFLDLLSVVGRRFSVLFEARQHGLVDVALSERLEDHVRGAHARCRHDLLQLGRTGKQNDGKRRLGGVQLHQQLE